MSNARRLGIAAVAFGVLAALVWGFTPAALLVDVVEVRQGRLEGSVSEEGETRLVRRYRVTAPVSGTGSRIDLEVGDRVNAGDSLSIINPANAPLLDARNRAEAEAAVAAASARLANVREQLAAAQAAADLADSDYKRIHDLYLKGDAAQAAVEAASSEQRRTQAMLRAAEFSVQVARHERSAAQAILDVGTDQGSESAAVTAPIDGVVLKVFRESEGIVVSGEPLVDLGDVADLEVQVDVLSSDAVRITEGMSVRFHRWGGEAPLEGTVKRVEPVGFTKISALGVEEQRVLVICDITSPRESWQRLGDGYRVEAEFIVWAADDVLQVPVSSVFRTRDGWAVFVAQDGRAQLRSVSPGQRSGLIAGIQSGLSVGEKVISHPGDSVVDGARVEAWTK
jgi:HlyD family secretion protein